MGQRRRVTIDWLRKGRKIDDLKILRNLIVDSSDWDIDSAVLDVKSFEKNYDLKSIPEETHSLELINTILGQSEVTNKVRVNKRPLNILEDEILIDQVASLLPQPPTIKLDERDLLSYVFSRLVLDDTPSDIKWLIVPEGLDNLSAALFTIHMIARLSGGNISWLYPVWFLKANKIKLRNIQMIINAIDSKSATALDEIMEASKKSIEELLVQDKVQDKGQDPLSDKIDDWRGNLPPQIKTLVGLEKELRRSQKKLKSSLKDADPELVEIFDIDDTEKRSALIEQLPHRKQTTAKKLEALHTEIMGLKTRLLVLQNTIRNTVNEIKDECASLKANTQSVTQWNIHSLRPDGPTASEHEPLLDNLRRSLNILNYKPLVQMCEYLAQSEEPGHPVASEIEEQLGLKRRMSHYALQRLGFVLNERYFPSLPKMGLRYRFIFTEKQKPGVLSEGLVERLILGESEYSGCTIHIEPIESQGPRPSVLPSKHHQLIVNSEILSMRMDLYDSKSGKWVLEPWKSAAKSREPTWLYRETEYPASETTSLTPRQLDILGPLCAFRGLRSSRNWLFEQLEYPAITSRRYLKKLLKQQALRLLYMPSLEYCDLPIGMIVASEFSNEKTLNSFIDWMTTRLPYVRAFTDRSTNLVAFIRLPTSSLGVVPGIIREKLMGSKSKSWFTSRIRSYRTYQMTVFHKLTRKTDGRWLDPWAT